MYLLKEITLYSDDNFIVVEKPSGLVVNTSRTTSEPTLQDLVLESDVLNFGHDDGVEDTLITEFESRSGIVHRLDKATSGLLLIAKHASAFGELKSKFQNREIQKEYVCLVHGRLPRKKVIVNAPIGRNKRFRTKFSISQSGRPAYTEFTLIKEMIFDSNYVSLVSAQPKTGRTHQIRVHCLAMNLPILGDTLYSPKKLLQWSKDHLEVSRLMLHAHKLDFTASFDDRKGEEYHFESEIPSKFTRNF